LFTTLRATFSNHQRFKPGFGSSRRRNPLLHPPPRSEVVSQCHSEEWSDEESAFWFCTFGTPTPIRHEYGRKADPSLGLRMTRARFFGLRHSLSRGRKEVGADSGLKTAPSHGLHF
jgi:hypothetical protein